MLVLGVAWPLEVDELVRVDDMIVVMVEDVVEERKRRGREGKWRV